jgi:hypothetical protein
LGARSQSYKFARIAITLTCIQHVQVHASRQLLGPRSVVGRRARRRRRVDRLRPAPRRRSACWRRCGLRGCRDRCVHCVTHLSHTCVHVHTWRSASSSTGITSTLRRRYALRARFLGDRRAARARVVSEQRLRQLAMLCASMNYQHVNRAVHTHTRARARKHNHTNTPVRAIAPCTPRQQSVGAARRRDAPYCARVVAADRRLRVAYGCEVRVIACAVRTEASGHGRARSSLDVSLCTHTTSRWPRSHQSQPHHASRTPAALASPARPAAAMPCRSTAASTAMSWRRPDDA